MGRAAFLPGGSARLHLAGQFPAILAAAIAYYASVCTITGLGHRRGGPDEQWRAKLCSILNASARLLDSSAPCVIVVEDADRRHGVVRAHRLRSRP